MQKKSCVWPKTVCRVAAVVMVVCGAFALPALADDSAGVSKTRLSLEERISAGDLKYRDLQTGEIVVNLELKETGARLFDEHAEEHYLEQFAIVLDGVVESAPSINATS